MRFILSFVLFTMFGFAQQNCHSEKVTGKPDRAKANSNMTTATVAPTVAAAFPEEAPRISLADAKKDFDAGNVVFIDTRAEASFKTEHIKGAINIPSGEFETRYKEVSKNKKIIAYCS